MTDQVQPREGLLVDSKSSAFAHFLDNW